MPNHINNRVKIIGNVNQIKEVFAHMKGDEEGMFFDLNKVVPRPESLNIISDGLIMNLNADYADRVTVKQLIEDIKKAPDDRIENLNKGIKNIQQHGHATWYEWSCSNWGTKWNAYEQSVEADTFIFDTAWSGIPGIIQKLSKAFPNVKIEYKYADEDTGNNVGVWIFESGNVTKNIVAKNGSKEAYDLAFELKPDYMKYYELIGGNYVCKDED